PGPGAVGLPDAELLRPAGVAARIADTETLQAHEAALGKQPVGTLPVHDAVLAPLRLGGDRELRDDPFGRLDDKGARRIGAAGAGLSSRVEPGLAKHLLAVPEDAESIRQVSEPQHPLLHGDALLDLRALPDAAFGLDLLPGVKTESEPLLAEGGHPEAEQ